MGFYNRHSMLMRHPPPTYRPVNHWLTVTQNEKLILEVAPLPQDRESIAPEEADRLKLPGEPATRNAFLQHLPCTRASGTQTTTNGNMSLPKDEVISISLKPALAGIWLVLC